MAGLPITPRQRDYITDLARTLHLPARMLDGWLRGRYDVGLDGLDRQQASAVIQTFQGWQELPSEMKKAMGQVALPGMG